MTLFLATLAGRQVVFGAEDYGDAAERAVVFFHSPQVEVLPFEEDLMQDACEEVHCA